MKDKIKKWATIISVLFILYLFFAPYIFIELWNIQAGRPTMFALTIDSMKNNIDLVINKSKYNKSIEEFIEKNFGTMSKKLKILDKSGYSYKIIIDDVMEKPFNVFYSKTNESCTSNITSVLATDPKFQHLYSEWVKKQIGIEDENVEFQFAGNFDNPYIEFDKITSLSEDYREIFENTHNLYAWLCEVSSIRDLTDENIIEIAKNIRENYLLKAIQITKIPTDKKFGGRIRISSGENTNEKSIVYNVDFDINSLSDNFSDMEYRKYD